MIAKEGNVKKLMKQFRIIIIMLTFYDKAILIEKYSFFLNKCINFQLMFLKFNFGLIFIFY